MAGPRRNGSRRGSHGSMRRYVVCKHELRRPGMVNLTVSSRQLSWARFLPHDWMLDPVTGVRSVFDETESGALFCGQKSAFA